MRNGTGGVGVHIWIPHVHYFQLHSELSVLFMRPSIYSFDSWLTKGRACPTVVDMLV